AALFGKAGAEQNMIFLEDDTLAALLAGLAVVLMPVFRGLWRPRLGGRMVSSLQAVAVSRVPALLGAFVLLVLCVGRMSVNSFQPFLYFRF
ncbi:MAG: hypothetical protein ACAI34_13515, partial [Verrucomicrobium sp.]